MGGKRRRLRPLARELARLHPELETPERPIAAGSVLVDGWPVTNPAALVRAGASIVVRAEAPLRGERKLAPALAALGVRVAGRVAVDGGAAAGGFTRALLAAGAGRVYAVDAGHGQLRGSLRQHPRVVALERVNVAELDERLVPDEVGVVALDLSYLAVARAAPQLGRLRFAPGAELVALVKPMFELGLAEAPTDDSSLARALERAARGVAAAGWRPVAAMRSPVSGAGGAVEAFLHARRERGVSVR